MDDKQSPEYYREFVNEYMNVPFSGENIKLMKLAIEYHERTENYDRSICSVFVNGIAVPTSPEERRWSNAFALQTYRNMWQDAKELGFTPNEWQAAIVHTSKHLRTTKGERNGKEEGGGREEKV